MKDTKAEREKEKEETVCTWDNFVQNNSSMFSVTPRPNCIVKLHA